MNQNKLFGIRYEDDRGRVRERFFRTKREMNRFVNQNSEDIMILAWLDES